MATSTSATSRCWSAPEGSTARSSSCPPATSSGIGPTTGGGLTMPEFAVVLAYTKIALFGELLASDVPEDPFLGRELEQYFPEVLRSRYADQIREHPLRREIIATRVTNSVVDRAGTTFIFRLTEETGMAAPDVARAHTAAREIFGLRDAVGADRRARRRRRHRHPDRASSSRCGGWPSGRPAGCCATAPNRWTSPRPPSSSGPACGSSRVLIPTLVTENRRRMLRAHRRRLRRRRRPEGPGVVGRDVARPHLGPGHHHGRPLHPAARRRGGRGLFRARRVPEAGLAAGPDTRPAARRPMAEPRPSRPP